MNSCVLFFASLYALVSICTFQILQSVQPDPYIDEIFHVPQAQAYCQGSFHYWNAKITTPPGLYLFSAGILKPFSCSLYLLRALNLFLSFLVFFLFYDLNNSEGIKKSWTAFNLSISPLILFYSCLYYTDLLSIFFVLLMIRLHRAGCFEVAALLGLLGCTVRQTNIVWVGFLLLEAAPAGWDDLRKLLRGVGFRSWASYSAVCSLFVLFIILNKGIVVGDKAAHEPVLHLMQIPYFGFFFFLFSWPHLFSFIEPFIRVAVRNLALTLALGLALCCLIAFNTLAHPYLLSDNRHFTFYLWRKLLFPFRYPLAPLYLFALFSTLQVSPAPRYSFWIAATFSLVPQGLLEFRYFLLPFFILRLRLTSKNTLLALESLYSLFVHCFALFIFVKKEFYWNDSDLVQRIGW